MKKIKLILPALVLLLFAGSCMVDDEVDTSFGESPYVIGFKNAVAAESFFVDEGAVLKEYAVDILGGDDGTPAEEDIVVSYTIDPSSTATEGQEFNFVDNSGTLTIPAGSTFAAFPLEINTGGLDPNEPTELILNLTGVTGPDSVISSLNDQLSITFVGCQSTVDQKTYMVTTTRTADGFIEKEGIETISMTSVNNFLTLSSGPFGPDARRGSIADENGFNFVDICGAITVADQGLANNAYSNPVSGSGSVDPETGTITINYTIGFGGVDERYRSVYVVQ